MRTRILASLLGLFLLAAPASAQVSPVLNQVQTFWSWAQTARAPDIAATTSSSDTVLGASAPVAIVYNIGSNIAYVKPFKSATTVTAATGIPIPAGGCQSISVAGQSHLAAISVGGTTTLQVALGTGVTGGCGGSSGGGGVNIIAAASGGYTYAHIAAGQATSVIKSSAGTLHSITFNSPATATNVTTIYDNTSGSGNIIGIPTATAVVAPVTVIYDLAFTLGLTIITGTANGSDMTVAFK